MFDPWIAFIRILDPGTVGNAEIFALKLGLPEWTAVNITNSTVDEFHPDWR